MKKCPQWASNPVPSTCELNALTVGLRDLISIVHIKDGRILPKFAIKIYLCHIIDVLEYFVGCNILLTLYIQQLS